VDTTLANSVALSNVVRLDAYRLRTRRGSGCVSLRDRARDPPVRVVHEWKWRLSHSGRQFPRGNISTQKRRPACNLTGHPNF